MTKSVDNEGVERQGVQNRKPVGGPSDPTTMANSEQVLALVTNQHGKYSTVLASLMFLAKRMRPDLSVAKSILCSHLNNSTTEHMASAKGTFPYLKWTSTYAIKFEPNKGDSLTAYADANRADYIEKNRKAARKRYCHTETWRLLWQHVCRIRLV